MEDGCLRGEADLLVFISSVMDDELKNARRTAKQAVCAYPITLPWTFECTPASSRPPAEDYLQNVEQADFVIWLIGQETTQPVVDEITTCISSGGSLLAFKLPAKNRDECTQILIQYVSTYATWKEVGDIEELSAQITAALSDALVKALRDPSPPARKSKLLQEHRLSVSRCKQTWISLGVPDDLAAELSEDQSVGDVLPTVPNPGLHLVTGDQGSGKSLALERLFQRLIKDALDRIVSDHSRYSSMRGT